MKTTATEIKLTKRVKEVEFENKILKEEIKRLIFMIDNGWGWEDAKNNYSQFK